MKRITLIPDRDLEPLSCKFDISVKEGNNIHEEVYGTTADFCYDLNREIELIISMFEEMVLPPEKMLKVIEKIKRLEHCEDISELINLSVLGG